MTRLETIRPLHVAGYIETMPSQPQTVKQALAAIRMLFDWLVIGQIVPSNPAARPNSSRLPHAPSYFFIDKSYTYEVP